MSIVCYSDIGPLAAAASLQFAFGLVSVTVCPANRPHRHFAQVRLRATALGDAKTVDRAVRSFPAREVQARVYACNQNLLNFFVPIKRYTEICSVGINVFIDCTITHYNFNSFNRLYTVLGPKIYAEANYSL